MKTTALLLGLLLALSGCISLEKEKVNNMSEANGEQKEQDILTQFISQYNSDVRITVKEQEDHWEIIVEHPDTDDGFTGGAEGYSLHRITGESEMMWHEHPMESEELVEDTE